MHPKNWRCIIESESLEKTYKMSLIIYLLEKQKQIFVFAVASGFSLFDTPFPKCQWTDFRVIQYIPRNMHTVFALLCFVVVIHWLIFPYPPGLLHWHCGNLTIAPVPAKQPWWIWINTSCEFIMNDCITTTKQITTKPCAYFLGYTVCCLILSEGYHNQGNIQHTYTYIHACRRRRALTFSRLSKNIPSLSLSIWLHGELSMLWSWGTICRWALFKGNAFLYNIHYSYYNLDVYFADMHS